METKLSKLKQAWNSGDRMGALRIAAKFPQLGAQKEAITRAWAAAQNPDFFEQIGQSPQDLIEFGYAAIQEKYKI